MRASIHPVRAGFERALEYLMKWACFETISAGKKEGEVSHGMYLDTFFRRTLQKKKKKKSVPSPAVCACVSVVCLSVC